MGTHYILGYQNTAVSEKDKFAYFMWLTNNGVIDKTTITTYFIKFNDVRKSLHLKKRKNGEDEGILSYSSP